MVAMLLLLLLFFFLLLLAGDLLKLDIVCLRPAVIYVQAQKDW